MEKRWIWPFELLDKLGEGGMGVVYRARYVVDNRHVAVKLLPSDIVNETILSRFERETEILKTLRHPNIVRSFGGVCEGNQRFYAMELVEGGTLDQLLEERGRLPWESAIQFALQMASGLSYAHERGVVHRDVKPGNFLMTPQGKLKLSDFGLATVVAATKITAAGKTMGTFPYMAPEQIRGRPPVSPQTDLYALGCVIFEMVTGRTPFTGETPAEVMHKHLDDVPPRMAEFAADCPASLESLVRDLLQKDPNDRPESAFIVAQRLMDVSAVVEVATPRNRTIESMTQTPRGTPVVPKAEVEELAERRWGLVAVLGALLAASLAWNFLSIGSASRSADKAEELWIKAFRSDRPDIRSDATAALGEIAKTSRVALDALALALDDPRPTVRESAVEALGAAGPVAKSAIPDLMRLRQRDESEFVRTKSAVAIKAIQEGPNAGGRVSIKRIIVWVFLAALAVAAVLFGLTMKRSKSATASAGASR